MYTTNRNNKIQYLLALTLTSCFFSQSSAQDYSNFLELRAFKYLESAFNFLSPTRYEFDLTIPASFPDEAKPISFIVDCTKSAVISGAGGLKASAGYGVKFSGTTVSIANFSVGCEKGFVYAKSPSLEFTLNAIDPISSIRREVIPETNFDILINDGYKYPNIKEDYFRYSLRVTLREGQIYADSLLDGQGVDSKDITVGISKNGKTRPLLYQGKGTIYDLPDNGSYSIFYNLGNLAKIKGWFALDITPSAGKIAWRKLAGPLK